MDIIKVPPRRRSIMGSLVIECPFEGSRGTPDIFLREDNGTLWKLNENDRLEFPCGAVIRVAYSHPQHSYLNSELGYLFQHQPSREHKLGQTIFGCDTTPYPQHYFIRRVPAEVAQMAWLFDAIYLREEVRLYPVARPFVTAQPGYRSGHLVAYHEQGMERVEPTLFACDKIGFEGAYIPKAGDHLQVYDPERGARVVWSGKLTKARLKWLKASFTHPRFRPAGFEEIPQDIEDLRDIIQRDPPAIIRVS